MTPGPDIILRIPGTKNLVKISTIASGNTFDARWWTDGKMEAPMMPDDPWFRRHPDSGETFWCDECEEIASEEPLLTESRYSSVPFAEDASENDLLAQLETKAILPDKERYIRTRIWWHWNDPARNSEEPLPRPPGFNLNLRRLADLLEDDNDSRVIKAEALRQLGDHANAAALLDHPFPVDLQSVVDLIRSANENCDTRVREIT